MLDQIERRRILEQPAGKHLVPGECVAGFGPLFNKHLNKGPGFGRLLPRQRTLAGCQPDHQIAQLPGLARFHHQVLRQVIALVEHADGGDAVFDRCAIVAFDRRACGNRGCGDRFGRGILLAGRLVSGSAAAQHQQCRASSR
jgi:hypothetical protein